MGNIEKELLEELNRFKEIGRNSENLNEQSIMVGIGGGSGFVKNQGVSDTLNKFNKRQEFIEQEVPELDSEEDIVLDPDAELEGGDEETEELEVGDEDMDMDIEEPESDSTELDITDLVKKEEEISNELESQSDILSKNTNSLDDLMSKLGDLEKHLGSMDDMVNKISDLENKIEKYRPRTEEEKLGLRKYDSGPFSHTLSDFFTDKEEVFDKTGKKQYILKQEDIENYNEIDIKNSFDSPEEE
jgi:chromosome segregation ATPase